MQTRPEGRLAEQDRWQEVVRPNVTGGTGPRQVARQITLAERAVAELERKLR
jgi:hypothetical protein